MRIAKTKIALALGVLALTAQVQADQLADIKAAGVVKVATFDANPPFGSVDPKTHQLVGYDVDFARRWQNRLGKTGAGRHQPGQPDPAAAIREGRPDPSPTLPSRRNVRRSLIFRPRILLPASSSSCRSNLPIGSTAIAKHGSARLKVPPANRRCISVSRSLACSPMTIFRWR